MHSKYLAKWIGALVASIAAIAAMAPLAQATTPAAGYEQFAGCPSPAEVSTVSTCFRSEIYGGHFHMGNKEVPITNPIILSGGLNKKGEGVGASPSGGLPPVKQQVPGGITGLTGLDWLVNFFNVEQLKLYAVTELAGVPSSPLANPVVLPIKVHLINSLLSEGCYVGSVTEPITLHLTTGTTAPPPPNEPITGKPAKPTVNSTTHIQTLSEGIFVDNSFAAPGATGCSLNLFGIPVGINGLVDSVSSLPAAAGTNETVQNFNATLVASKFVYP